MTRMLQFIDDYDVTKEVCIVGELDRSIAGKQILFAFFFSLAYFSFLQDGFQRRIAPIGGRFVAQLWTYRGRDIASQATRIYASSLGSDRSVTRRVRIIDARDYVASPSLAIRAFSISIDRPSRVSNVFYDLEESPGL